MGTGTQCWLCESRGEGLLMLRPSGAADGRRVCRGCAGGLIAYVEGELARGGPPALAPVFEGAAAWGAPPGPGEGGVGALFSAAVLDALPGEGEEARAGAATAFLAMEMWLAAVEALSRVPPEAAVDGRLSERTLVSLLSRLLDEAALAPEARAVLAGALRAGPGTAP